MEDLSAVSEDSCLLGLSTLRLFVGTIILPKRRELLAGQCHIPANANLAEIRTASISGSLQVYTLPRNSWLFCFVL
jgi:hypothetical protein